MRIRSPCLLALPVTALLAGPAAASNHHCANEQPISASKRIVIARELTETSDIYVTCWRATNRHWVVAKFPEQDHQTVAFRIRGEWVVWRYRAGRRDRMGAIDARTGRHGPAVDVPVQDQWPFQLNPTGGPVARDIGDHDVMQVYIGSNGYYAWPVYGALPEAQGGAPATAMYAAAGNGDDVRLDAGQGVYGLTRITIRGSTLRWRNHGTHKHALLGPVCERRGPAVAGEALRSARSPAWALRAGCVGEGEGGAPRGVGPLVSA